MARLSPMKAMPNKATTAEALVALLFAALRQGRRATDLHRWSAARAAQPAAGADGPVGERARLRSRGSAAAPLADELTTGTGKDLQHDSLEAYGRHTWQRRTGLRVSSQESRRARRTSCCTKALRNVGSRQARERFRREIEAVKRLDDPGS